MWSQQELADALGTTQNTVSRWELGKTTPSPYFTKKMCEIFDKTPQDLGFCSGVVLSQSLPVLNPTHIFLPNESALSQPRPALNPVHVILPNEATIFRPARWTAPQTSKRDRMYLFRFFKKKMQRTRAMRWGILCTLLLVGGNLLKSSSIFFPNVSPLKRILCIATDFPTSGDDTAGISLEHAVQMALNQSDLGSGFTLKLLSYDDVDPQTRTPSPLQGRKNIQAIISNPCIVAVVGPGDSNVAEAEIPLATAAQLVLISPAATEPCLTLPADIVLRSECGVDPSLLHLNGQNTFFRLPPNDDAQSKIVADLISNPVPVTRPNGGLGAHRVYVIDDGESFGQGLAQSFEASFQEDNGHVLGQCSLTSGACEDIPHLAAMLAHQIQPPVIFYAGTTSAGGRALYAALAQEHFAGTLIGSDGIADDLTLLNPVGATLLNQNTYATLGERDVADQQPSQRTVTQNQFVSQYLQTYQQLPGRYSASSYDATMVLTHAIAQVIQQRQAVTRAAVLQAVQHTSYDGLTGPISFDASGDNDNGQFSLFEVTNKHWKFLRTLAI